MLGPVSSSPHSLNRPLTTKRTMRWMILESLLKPPPSSGFVPHLLPRRWGSLSPSLFLMPATLFLALCQCDDSFIVPFLHPPTGWVTQTVTQPTIAGLFYRESTHYSQTSVIFTFLVRIYFFVFAKTNFLFQNHLFLSLASHYHKHFGNNRLTHEVYFALPPTTSVYIL